MVSAGGIRTAGTTLLTVCRLFRKVVVSSYGGKYVELQTMINQHFTSGVTRPQKPRRPSGTFMLFSQEKRQQVEGDNPGLTFPEIAKVIGRMWKELPELEKESYRSKASLNMERYNKEMAAFKASLTPDDKMWMEQHERQSKASKAKRKWKQEMKQLEKPKRPLTAYSIFLQSKLKHATGNAVTKMAAVGKEWREMAEGDKLVYVDLATQARMMYQAEMEKWESTMSEKGKLSVIRKNNVSPKPKTS